MAGEARLVNALCEMAWGLFFFFTKDPIVSNCRKLLAREQYNNAQIAQLYNSFFLEGAVKSQAQTFAVLISAGMFRKENTEIVALHFYGSIFYLLQQYDCDPEKEAEIKEMLYAHIVAFEKNYEEQCKK